MSNELHMDVHQWVECTLVTENNACLICLTFLKAVPAYEATEVKVITFTSYKLRPM